MASSFVVEGIATNQPGPPASAIGVQWLAMHVSAPLQVPQLAIIPPQPSAAGLQLKPRSAQVLEMHASGRAMESGGGPPSGAPAPQGAAQGVQPVMPAEQPGVIDGPQLVIEAGEHPSDSTQPTYALQLPPVKLPLV